MKKFIAIMLLVLICVSYNDACLAKPAVSTLKFGEFNFIWVDSPESSSISDFYMLDAEVTNKQFSRYLKESKSEKNDQLSLALSKQEGQPPDSPIYRISDSRNMWSGNESPKYKEDRPVVLVSIRQAIDFCRWLNNAYPNEVVFRLPTISEWKVATYGVNNRPYPWGEKHNAQYYRILKPQIPNRKQYVLMPEPVKKRPMGRTTEGIYGLWGNVNELVIRDAEAKSFFDLMPMLESVWVGGGFKDEKINPNQTYWGYTHSSKSRMDDVGFRVVLIRHPKNKPKKSLNPIHE
jgi:formylglycine-generating enzyme required for sulfatase activity